MTSDGPFTTFGERAVGLDVANLGASKRANLNVSNIVMGYDSTTQNLLPTNQLNIVTNIHVLTSLMPGM